VTTTTATTLRATVDPVRLGAALQVVCRAISPRTTLPILQNLLLEATDEGLSLTATNLELSIRQVVPAEVAVPGATTVPARLLADFVATLPATRSLTLGLDDTTLALECGRIETHIRCMPDGEFPPGPRPDGGDRLTAPLAGLLRAIEHTQAAADTNEARPVLTGELLEIGPEGLALVATDGHRLAVAKLAAATSEIPAARLIVPARALAELPRAFKGQSGDVEVLVSLARNQVFFRCGTSEVATRLIDGQYPNYTQVVPREEAKTIARASTAELVQAVKAVSQFAKDGATTVRLALADGAIRVSAATNEVGDGQADIDAEIEGDDVIVAFNGKYLLDALGTLGDRVELRSDGALSPALMRTVGDESALHVIMPVRTAQ